MAVKEPPSGNGFVDGHTIEQDTVLLPRLQDLTDEQIDLSRAMAELADAKTVPLPEGELTRFADQESRLARESWTFLDENPTLAPLIANPLRELTEYQSSSADELRHLAENWIIARKADLDAHSIRRKVQERAGMLRSLTLQVSFASLDHVVEHILAEGKMTSQSWRIFST